MTSKPLVSRTLATLRNAEFGFFGVVVYTRVQTPRFCGEACSAGTVLRDLSGCRGLAISWLIVGILLAFRYSRLGARARNRSGLSACFLLARTVLADRFLGFSARYSHATFPRAKTKWRHPLGNAGAFFRSDDHKAVKHRGRSV